MELSQRNWVILTMNPVLQDLSRLDVGINTVVVVDDNPVIVELLTDTLENLNQQVVSASSGAEALLKMSEIKPDLILLDVMMPEMDGFQVLEVLKQNPDTANIPVILISALNQTEDMVRGFEEGSYDYITKPFKIEEVKARVFGALRMLRLQNTLRDERDKLKAIFRYSADGIVLLDADLQVVSANPVASQWFGLTLTDSGAPVESVFFLTLLGCQCDHADVCPMHLPANRDLECSDIKEAVLTDDLGEQRFLNIHCGHIYGTGKALKGYVVVIRDVTQDKAIEQHKETFVATLTHDLKTPIRAEQRVLELLLAGDFGTLQDEQRNVVDEILHSNRYMGRLVDNLLMTYMAEEGKLEIKPDWVNLHSLLEEAILPPITTLAKQKSQEVLIALDSDLPRVYADGLALQRVIFNLLQNAVTYTPEQGKIWIRAQRLPYDKIQIQIEDSGPGIPEAQQAHLFERYYSMARQFHSVGVGLGLYLSRYIVEAHGGSIEVSSQEGKGACFNVLLPLKKAP